MKATKARLTVTVDAALVRAATAAVAAGEADSVSAWVNRALSERATKEAQLRALGQAIAAYETEFGAISPEEMAAQQRGDRRAARVVRGPDRSTRLAPKSPRRVAQRRGVA